MVEHNQEIQHEEESLEEYIEKFIEGAKSQNAFNDQSVHDTLVVATERRLKRHGKVITLDNISSD